MEDISLPSIERYIILYGVMIALDGFKQMLSDEIAKNVKLEGLTVLRIEEPNKAICNLFALNTPIFTSDCAVKCFSTSSISRTESFLLGRLILTLDPKREIGIKCSTFFIDTKEARVTLIRKPSKEEMVGVAKEYQRLRIGDSEEEIRESREIRKAVRLGHSKFPRTPYDERHDPEDRSGLEAELDLLVRAEEKSEKAKEDRERVVLSKGITDPTCFALRLKKFQEMNQGPNRKLRQLREGQIKKSRVHKIGFGSGSFQPKLQRGSSVLKREELPEFYSDMTFYSNLDGVDKNNSDAEVEAEVDEDVVSDTDLFGDKDEDDKDDGD